MYQGFAGFAPPAVAMPDPMRRGLKHTEKKIKEDPLFLNVAMLDPMRRGLKPSNMHKNVGAKRVAMPDPMKRGLKPLFWTDFCFCGITLPRRKAENSKA